MKSKKKLIIFICILLVLIITISIVLSLMNKKRKDMEYMEEQNPRLTTSLEVKEVNSETEFFTVQECINKYFKSLNDNNADAVYNMLSNKYIKKNNITNANVLQIANKLENGYEEFNAKKVYSKEISYEKEYQYYIFGDLLGNDYKTIDSIYIIVNLDFVNMAFNVEYNDKIQLNKEEYQKTISDLKNSNSSEYIYVEDQQSSEIKSNKYNNFTMVNMEQNQIMDYYLKNYVTMAVYYPDRAYSLLDDEYKNNRFGNLENYKNYISQNKENLLNFSIKEYNISEHDKFLEYIIIDTNENYYIFKITDIMEYTLITDFYTINVESITNKYDNSTIQEKVAINIQKVVAAINNKDYRYIYSKLSEGYKSKYYPNLVNFENYMSNNFYGKLQVLFNSFYNEGETYIYNITLQGMTASNNTEIDMQIIMQLKEKNDFVISFNIK